MHTTLKHLIVTGQLARLWIVDAVLTSSFWAIQGFRRRMELRERETELA